jgi:hypothetical protein
LCVISHESLEILFCKHVLQHGLIKLCPQYLLSFNVFKLHVTSCNGHHFTISKIVHMTSHSCLANNMLHMINMIQAFLQIPSKLHSHDDASSIPTPFINILKMKTFCLTTWPKKQHS